MRLLLYQIGPLVVLLLPLIEVAAFTAYWRDALERKWLFAFVGCLAVYAMGAAIFWLVDRFGPMHTYSAVLVKVEPGMQAQPERSEFLEPHMLQFFVVVIAILLVGAAVLWGIKCILTKT
jgi:hypothetical protein